MHIKYDSIGLLGLMALVNLATSDYDQFVTVRHQIPKDLKVRNCLEQSNIHIKIASQMMIILLLECQLKFMVL